MTCGRGCKILADVPDSDLVEFYNRAEIFIYPSFYEGFGLPILEAMACGAPVISSSASSMPEVGRRGRVVCGPCRWLENSCRRRCGCSRTGAASDGC